MQRSEAQRLHVVQPWILAAAFAVALAQLPAVRADDLLTGEQLDHVQWKFSSFLTGDTLKIRDTINGTLEQQLNRKAEKTHRIDVDKAAITAAQQAAGMKLATASPTFAKLQSDLTAARAQATLARKASDTVAMMKAENTADTLSEQITSQEDSAIANDPDVLARRKEIKDTQAELRTLEPAIASATKARDQLVDGMRTSLKIPGPPTVGGQGILGRIKPTKIVDEHSFTADYEALQILGDNKNGKAPDGMKAMNVKPYKVHILVTGVDTAKLKVGTEALMDHHFVITASQQSGKNTVYVVSPSTSDLTSQARNHLFDLLDELRVGGG
jgi:hypothetical protein